MTVEVFKQTLLSVLLAMLLVFNADAEQTDSNKVYPDILDYPHSNTLDFQMNAIYMRQNFIRFTPHSFQAYYDWGFEMRADYTKSDGRFFYVNWYHYKSVKPDLNAGLIDFNLEGSTFIDYGYTSYFDLLFIEGGLTFFSSNKLDVSLHGGILLGEMGNIQDFNVVSNISQASLVKDVELTYEGIGPVLGLDLNYHLTRRFEIYLLSEITMMIRAGDIAVTNTSVNLKGTQTTFSDDNLKGATEGVVLQIGGKYRLPLKREGFEVQTGWLSIMFNEVESQWSGGFVGARWFGDI